MSQTTDDGIIGTIGDAEGASQANDRVDAPREARKAFPRLWFLVLIFRVWRLVDRLCRTDSIEDLRLHMVEHADQAEREALRLLRGGDRKGYGNRLTTAKQFRSFITSYRLGATHSDPRNAAKFTLAQCVVLALAGEAEPLDFLDDTLRKRGSAELGVVVDAVNRARGGDPAALAEVDGLINDALNGGGPDLHLVE